MAQQTAQSVMALPGIVHSFVAKAIAGSALCGSADVAERLEGMANVYQRLNGTLSVNERLAGSVEINRCP